MSLRRLVRAAALLLALPLAACAAPADEENGSGTASQAVVTTSESFYVIFIPMNLPVAPHEYGAPASGNGSVTLGLRVVDERDANLTDKDGKPTAITASKPLKPYEANSPLKLGSSGTLNARLELDATLKASQISSAHPRRLIGEIQSASGNPSIAARKFSVSYDPTNPANVCAGHASCESKQAFDEVLNVDVDAVAHVYISVLYYDYATGKAWLEALR